MPDSLTNLPYDRCKLLNQEIQQLNIALNGSTLLGVLDREKNHIAAMQEEIDQKVREALVAYWLSQE